MVDWKNIVKLFHRRATVYHKDAEKIKKRVHRAFLSGKGEGYRDIASGIAAMVKRGLGLDEVLATLRARHKDYMKESRRTAGKPVISADLEGYAQSNREAMRDVLAAAGRLPYLG